MTELNDREANTPPTRAEPRRPIGLLWASACLATMIGVLGGIYACRNTVFPAVGVGATSASPTGLFPLGVLALQLLLAAQAAWSALSALRVRQEYRLAEQIRRGEGPAAKAPPPTRASWSHAETQQRPKAPSFEVVLGDADHARKLHYLLAVAIPLAGVVVVALWQLGRNPGTADPPLQEQAVTLGILAMAASCVWLVLSRSFGAMDREELPEAPGLVMAFRESQWTSLAVAAGVLGSLLWQPLENWTARGLLVWIALVAGESLGRSMYDWLRGPGRGKTPLPAIDLVSRRAVLVRGNPVSSLFEMIEQRYGVSFRSSWAIRFVRRAATPLVLMACLLFWGMSCLSMVGPSELGIRESFGVPGAEPLEPGLHLKLPWPMGRVRHYPVKKVFVQPVGFETADQADSAARSRATSKGDTLAEQLKDFRSPRAYLWTTKHGGEEFALVLGSGTEVVAVNALVYYKIREDRQGFFDFVYGFQNPVDALAGYAYRALMEKTRSATLAQVLSTDRAAFARDLQRLLRQYADENRLGLDVVEVALVSLHPPIDAAPDYLDVINARNDATRAQTEATGKRHAEIHKATTAGGGAVAKAKVWSAGRVGEALQESAEFRAVGGAYSVDPEAFKLRLRGDTLQEILSQKSFVLIDKCFPDGPGGVTVDARDLRPGADTPDRLPLGERQR